MLKLSSHLRNIPVVENYIENVVNKYKVSPDKYGNILISMTEAVTNAIRHGNDHDETKNVQVTIQKRKNTISCRVSDEGPGFDYNSLPDPTCPENILKCGGRGVFLMRELADDIQFLDNGSTVEMRFKIH